MWYNPVAPVVWVDLDRRRPLLITHWAMAQYEGATGKNLVETDSYNLPALLWAALLHGDPAVQPEQALQWWRDAADRDALRDAVMQAFHLALPEPLAKEERAMREDEARKATADPEPVTWLTMWAQAVQVLGMTDAEFWGSTPRQFTARLRAHQQQEERADFRAGQIAATVANHTPGRKGPPVKPENFFGLFSMRLERALGQKRRLERLRAAKREREAVEHGQTGADPTGQGAEPEVRGECGPGHPSGPGADPGAGREPGPGE